MSPEELFRRQVRPHLVLGAPRIAFPIQIWAVAAFGFLFAAAVVSAFFLVPYGEKHQVKGHFVPSSGLVDVRAPASLRVLGPTVTVGTRVRLGQTIAWACEPVSNLAQRPRLHGRSTPDEPGGSEYLDNCGHVSSLTAPVAGEISYTNLAAGIDIREGELAASIVSPASEIIAVLFAPAELLASLNVGDTLRLKADSLPYQRHGHIEGIITSISVSPREGRVAGLSGVKPFYRVEVALHPRDATQRRLLEKIAVGMAVTADFRSESRTLAQQVF